MVDFSLLIHEEILLRFGTEWSKVTTEFRNQILDEAEELDSELNDRIRDIVNTYEEKVKEVSSKT